MRDAAGNLVGRRTPLEVTRAATERVCRYAFELARKRKRAGHPGKLTCVVKSNIVGAHRYFEEVFRELGQQEFADIEQDVAMFDAFCMWQIRNPEWFDVVVAPNLVGDVISDNGSTTQGGMGMAAGGNIGFEHGMFEPIHGSAPKHRGLNKVNPMAAILSASMMCDWLPAGSETSIEEDQPGDRSGRGLGSRRRRVPGGLGGAAAPRWAEPSATPWPQRAHPSRGDRGDRATDQPASPVRSRQSSGILNVLGVP